MLVICPALCNESIGRRWDSEYIFFISILAVKWFFLIGHSFEKQSERSSYNFFAAYFVTLSSINIDCRYVLIVLTVGLSSLLTGLCRFLNQAMQLFDSTTVVPTNFVFFTISAILSGKLFNSVIYHSFHLHSWGSVIITIRAILSGKSQLFSTCQSWVSLSSVASSLATFSFLYLHW